jgi:hypothetical protein
VNRLQGEVESKNVPLFSRSSRRVQATTFVVTLQAAPGHGDPIHAMRRLLKFALRQCGLRCVDAREVLPTGFCEQLRRALQERVS